MKKIAIIVAGGNGSRMGASVPKQFLLLQQKPLLWHTLRSFLSAYDDLTIILVVPKENFPEGEKLITSLNAAERIQLVEGGQARFHSVQNGLALVTEPSVVFVHDGVRCLVTKNLIQRCYEQAIEKGSAIPVVVATDSIRLLTEDGHTVADRNKVCIIQTPQTFLSSILLPAFTVAYSDSFTDEATVVEASGQKVFLIEGDYQNIKITRPADLLVAESILSGRMAL